MRILADAVQLSMLVAYKKSYQNQYSKQRSAKQVHEYALSINF